MLVPTLSATEALLSALQAPGSHGVPDSALGEAAARGLRALLVRLGPGASPRIADTIAVELIVPALVEAVNEHMARLGGDLRLALGEVDSARLVVPGGSDRALLDALRDVLRAGRPLPEKLAHTLEVAGSLAPGAAGIRPVRGSVGCSPAATAAWLGSPPHTENHECVAYLNDLVARYDGLVPGVSPITYFERSWVLTALLDAGLEPQVPPQLVDGLLAGLGDDGIGVAPGLLCDSDCTACTLVVLGRLGVNVSGDCLLRYDAGTHFQCWPGERNPSISVNAHVLAALAEALRRDPERHAGYSTPAAAVARWLEDHQRDDGSWLDKWHASPFYATFTCVRALDQFHAGAASAAATRARAWVLECQHDDGSWGIWGGSPEETAYAIRILARSRAGARTVRAVARACDFLDGWGNAEHPPLWHDKDLYAPTVVVDAAVVAAQALAGRLLDRNAVHQTEEIPVV